MSEWRRASGCAASECIEVRADDDECWISIRGGWPFFEIANGEKSTGLMFEPDHWAVFAAAVKAGEFDDLA